MNGQQRSNKSMDSLSPSATCSTSYNAITKETEFTQVSEPRFQIQGKTNIGSIAPPSPTLQSTSPLLEHPAPFTIDVIGPLPFPDAARPTSPGPRGFRTRVSQVTTSITTPRKKPQRSSNTHKHARIYALVAFMVFLVLLIVWVCNYLPTRDGLLRAN
jgi:hypothetical protein